jgi:chorismate synthase
MSGLRYLTAGESHGPVLIGILEGLPAGLEVDSKRVDEQLARRQGGYGRGRRMAIEHDRVEFLSGLRFGRTLGSPIALRVPNLDWENWKEKMAPEGEDPGTHRITLPRPGHADYAGGVKYGHTADMRNVLERASARETAMRVALGSLARIFLAAFDVALGSAVVRIGEAVCEDPFGEDCRSVPDLETIDASPVRCHDSVAGEAMEAEVDGAGESGDTLGGEFVVWATGLPIGLGSHIQWDRRLDGRVAQAMMSIPAVKGVEIGPAFVNATRRGSEVHDPFRRGTGKPGKRRVERSTNRAGGLEGGITNGELLIVRAGMKPISTLLSPVPSVDLSTGDERGAHIERSDVCAVPAAGVIGEAVLALVLADALLEKFGGDTLEEVRAAWSHHLKASPRV